MTGVAGSQPQNLTPEVQAPPIPRAPSMPMATPPQAPAPAGTPSPSPQGPTPEEIQALLKQNSQPEGPSPEEIKSLLAQNSSEPSFGQELSGLSKASFAHTDAQKKDILEQSFGTDNVRKQGDQWQYLKDGKWNDTDRGFFQAAKDLAGVYIPGLSGVVGEGPAGLAKDVAANIHPIIRETVAAPIEAVGAIASGSEAVTGAGALAVPATLAASRAVGGLAGNATADWIGGKLGIKPDNADDQVLRYGIDAGSRVVFGAAADKLFSWASGKLGTAAADRAAGSAAKQEALDKVPEVSLTNHINDIKDTEAQISAAQNMGLLDKDFKLRPDQMTNNPEMIAAAQKASKSEIFRSMADGLGDKIAGAWDKITTASRSLAGQSGLAKKTLDYLSSSDNAFGSLLGEFRDRLAAFNGNTAIKVKNLEDLFPTFEQLGFKTGKTTTDMQSLTAKFMPDPSGKELQSPSAEWLADKLDLTGPSRTKDAERIIGFVNKIHDAHVNGDGMVDAKILNQMYSELSASSGLINSAIRDPQRVNYTGTLIKLKDAIRDDVADGMGTVFGDSAGTQYQTAMGRYRMFREADKALKGMIDNPNVGTDQFLKTIFSPNTSGQNKLGQLKTILDAHDPQLFESLKGAWWQKLMDDNAFEAGTAKAKRLGGYDWIKIRDSVNNLGNDTLEKIYTPDQLKQMNVFFDIAGKMQKSDFAYLASDLNKEALSKGNVFTANIIRGANAAMAFMRGNYNRASPGRISADAADLVSHIAPDELAMKYIMNGGDKDILKLIPSRQQAQMKTFLDKVKDSAITAGQNGSQTLGTLPGMTTNPMAAQAAHAIGNAYGNNPQAQP